MTDDIAKPNDSIELAVESISVDSTSTPTDNLAIASLQYTEANNTFRHYAESILRIRGIIVVQGIAILAAAAYLFNNDKFLESSVVAGFGFALTFTLSAMQWHYRSTCIMITDYIRNLEARLANDGHDSPDFWTTFLSSRASSTPFARSMRWAAVYGPFILFSIAFVGILITGLCQSR